MIILAYPSDYAPLDFPLDDVLTVTEHVSDFSRWPRVIQGPPRDSDPAYLSEYLQIVATIYDIKCIVPLTEECVLACAIANEILGLKGINLDMALKCVDKFAQRKALHFTGHNPIWSTQPNIKTPFVLKTVASRASKGVQIVENKLKLNDAQKKAQEAAQREMTKLKSVSIIEHDFIYEEIITGDQYEISGVCLDEQNPIIFKPLRQIWNGKSVYYKDIYNDETLVKNLTQIATKCVKAVGLKWCGWHMEIRGNKIIKIHCHLGEDSDTDSAGSITTMCQEILKNL